MNRYSIGFLFSEDRTKLLLIQKISNDDLNGKLTAVGGGIDSTDPSPEYALSREFEEEVGLIINPLSWRLVSILKTLNGEVNVFVYFSDYLYAFQQEEEEVPCIISLDQVPDNIYRNLNWLIPMCLDERIRSSNISYL